MIAYAFLLCAPPLALLYFINAFGVNVIIADEWDKVPLLQKFGAGTLTFSDLFEQHNEHRIVSERLVAIGLAELTRYNIRSEMFFNWLILCLTALIIFYVYWKRSVEIEKNARLLILVPISLLLFSFRQSETILSGGTIQYYTVILGAVAALAALHASRKLDGWFAAAILAAVLASYSFATGLAVWIVGLFQILMLRRNGFVRKSAVWSIVGALAWIFYFIGYMKPAASPSTFYALRNPAESFSYFLALIGAPFTFRPPSIAVAFGLVVVLVATLVMANAFRAGMIRQESFLVSLAIFIAINSAAITLGRSGLGVEQGLSRYTSMTSVGIVAVYLLAQKISVQAKGRGKSFAFHALLTLIFVGLIISYGVGWYAGVSTHNSERMSGYVLKTYQYQSNGNIQQYLYRWNADFVRVWAPYLEQKRLNVFAEPQLNSSNLIPYNSQTIFSVDTVNGSRLGSGQPPKLTIPSNGETLIIQGWAIDKQTSNIASAVYVVINGKMVIPALYGMERRDVAVALHNPRLIHSGWVASFSTSVFIKGDNAMSLKIVGSDGHHYYSTETVLRVVVF